MWKCGLVLLALATIVAEARINTDPLLNINLKPLKTSAHRIRGHGYPAETHSVETSDGYILNIFRIPYSHHLNNENEKRPVIFLQHGLFSNSDCFLLNGPENALAFNLADAGFDVWLGNGRGNIYSLNHTSIPVDHPDFWRFSWHEIGAIDMADCIDYILETTGESSLHYGGHSQGGTVYFVLMSSRPEYNDKVKTAHLLAPAVFMGNTTHSLVHFFHPYVKTPGGLGTKILGDQLFLPSNPLLQRALDTACGGDATYPEYCRTLFMSWAGTEATNINETLLPLMAETHPAGISTNQGIHYIHLYGSNMFRQFDHGKRGNMKRYGQPTPPDYPLEKITSSLHVYYGFSDTSVNWRDIERLPEHLPNLKHLYLVPDKSWSHIDFIFAKKVKETINDHVVDFCLKYEKEHEIMT